MNWKEYIGKTVSILITGKDSKIENYMGIIQSVSGGFMVIDTNNPNFTIDKVIFKTNLILGIWIYKEKPRA